MLGHLKWIQDTRIPGDGIPMGYLFKILISSPATDMEFRQYVLSICAAMWVIRLNSSPQIVHLYGWSIVSVLTLSCAVSCWPSFISSSCLMTVLYLDHRVTVGYLHPSMQNHKALNWLSTYNPQALVWWGWMRHPLVLVVVGLTTAVINIS